MPILIGFLTNYWKQLAVGLVVVSLSIYIAVIKHQRDVAIFDLKQYKLAVDQQKVDQHEREIEQIGLSTKEMIDGQKQVSRSINDLTITLNRYIDRHDSASKQQEEIKEKLENQASQIASIKEQNSANQLVIDGVKSLNAKLIWLIVAAMASPAAVVGFVAVKAGGA